MIIIIPATIKIVTMAVIKIMINRNINIIWKNLKTTILMKEMIAITARKNDESKIQRVP